jgi:ribonucleotide reductase beta subunit family protein with ferritin-like domain
VTARLETIYSKRVFLPRLGDESSRFGRVQVDQETVEIEEFVTDPRPFRALYEHWERHQWSPFEIDFSVDAESFAALDETTRTGLAWVFAHRFHAEFNVAALLAPFLLAAPDYDVQLLLATQVADEHRHIESLLRVFSEVFGVEGGFEAVKAFADGQLDPVAASLHEALDGMVRALETNRGEDAFLRAVVAYHLLAEGSIGRANQSFVATQFDRLGSFPGLREAQRLAVRDEVRHIGIGVSYARRRIARDGQPARALIAELVDGFHALGENLLEHTSPELAGDFAEAYGAKPATLWAEVQRQLQLRLRSLGLTDTSY